MAHTSLRTRIMAMTALPAFVAALLIGGYTLATRVVGVRADNAHRQQLIIESYAARLAALDVENQESYRTLLHDLLEQPDVRTATLIDHRNGQELHAGPRSRPVEKAEQLDSGATRLVTDSGWQWVRPLPGADDRMLTVEFSRQGQYVNILEAILAVVGMINLVLLLALVPATHFSQRLTRPIQVLIDSLRRVRDGDLTTPPQAHAPGELRDLEFALHDMVAALEQAQTELQHHMDQATRDLRETLETVEVQNIELDMARKEALEASRTKSEFLANISHEIRTPLNGVIGFTELLARSPLNERQRDYLSTIRKSAESLMSIINGILDFSKIDADKLSLDQLPFDLHVLIDDVQTMLAPTAQKKGLEQATIIYSDVPTHLLGDSLRIGQVLVNLINNAIKFTERGSVVVRAMLEQERGAEAEIKITVTDTGKGLAAEAQKNLFNAFTQLDQGVCRREGGAGLGLAISKGLVERMGGEIGLTSTVGHGSTFWFTLRAERDVTVTPDPPPLAEFTVTLVEANEHARLALYHMFGGWRMGVTELQALDSLETQLDNNTLAATDFYVLGVPAAQRDPDSLIPLLERLARATGKPLLILAAHADTLADRLTDLPAPWRVLGKPAARQQLRDSLLELGGLATPQPVSKPVSRSGRDARVLLVDDHPGNLKLARIFLEEMGVRVDACTSGKEALAAFAKNAFDLVFMDVQMPQMDGLETTRRMREREDEKNEDEGRRTPIVALTAHALENERRSLLAAGMDDYLSKPISEAQLRYTLDRWLPDETSAPEPATDAPAPQPEPPPEPESPPETPSQAAPATTPVLDRALGLRRTGGRENLADDLFSMLLTSLERDAPGISAVAESGDRDALLERVHKLHGATRYCGTPRLEQSARELEVAIKRQADGDRLDALVAVLLAEIENVRRLENKSLYDLPAAPLLP